MLFGDADVEVTLGKELGITHHPRAFAHRGRDRDEPLVARRHVAEPVAEDLGVSRLAAGFAADDAVVGLELRHAVVEHRVGLGELVALAFARDHVQKLRTLELA